VVQGEWNFFFDPIHFGVDLTLTCPYHTKLLTHIPNKKELHLTAHASTTVEATLPF
jgi:hypothetical protein